MASFAQEMNWSTAELSKLYQRRGASVPESLAAACDGPKPSKYRSRKKEIDGIVFDSAKESRCYVLLKMWLHGGIIASLDRQVPFVLQEKMPGHRAIKIVVDFLVTSHTGKLTVYEVKTGITKTPAYRIKRKLFAARYPEIEFVEWE